ncbi:serine hydroxymethyltransferase [Leptolyngbya sp. 15MV]|nr:serine hydroxymethyltransferase [Leptolyngbya sp. 15MV]
MASDPISAAVLDLLRTKDPQVAQWVAKEAQRQASTIELIASENHVSPAVMHAMGTCLTNKYAEGYPGARYYGGCVFHDEVERIAIQRACALFGCGFANVQPHSGAQANAAVFLALMDPGDTFASLVLADGGHLSHGMKINLSGKWFKPVHYPLHYDRAHPEFERIDYDAVDRVCREHKPKVLMCGYSAYPRVIDFERMRRAADACGAILVADIAHIAGLVAAGVHPSPFPHAHIVTTTTHKTLRGPRGGLILTSSEELAKKIDKAVFPGTQGGPPELGDQPFDVAPCRAFMGQEVAVRAEDAVPPQQGAQLGRTPCGVGIILQVGEFLPVGGFVRREIGRRRAKDGMLHIQQQRGIAAQRWIAGVGDVVPGQRDD